MQTLKPPAPKIKKSKDTRAVVSEQSLGIRICALSLVLLLVLAASSYVPTAPAVIFIYSLVALVGSYLAYIFRNKRPRWLPILPTVGAFLLFANFIFELSFALTAGQSSAVTSFVHMLAGLLALHCFDLRTRADFSISALIGLGLLTFLTGVARDLLFGIYILIYTILGGMLLFYDSSSRSHEIGPSRAVADGQVEGQPMIRRLRVASMTAMLPILLIPLASAATCFVLPKGDSMLELFVDSFRAQFPLSASLGGYLSRGGRSQSVRGGAPSDKKEGGASYSAKGGEGKGTASSTEAPGEKGGGSGPGTSAGNGPGAGAGSSGKVSSKPNPSKSGSAMPGLSNQKGKDIDPGDLKMQAALAKERKLLENYNKETIELKSAPSNADEVVLKIGSQIPTYTRRYTLDFFDGNEWRRANPVAPKLLLPTPKIGFDLTASDAVYVPPDLPTEEVTQEYRVEAPLGYILPHAWMPQIVKIDETQLRMDSDGTIKMISAIGGQTHYSVVSQVPVYDLEMMRRLPKETLYQVDEERVDELKTAQACLQLPAELNPKIKSMSADAVGIEGNWFSKAERIAEYLRAHYHYDSRSFLEAPTVPAPAKSESQTAADEALKALQAELPINLQKEASKIPVSSDLDKFLFERKVGNCRQFATAFAILCRSQGIPARVVVGFRPGELNKKTGYYEIRGRDSHVWNEVYIPYWNWVPFDSVPSGLLPAHQEGGNPLTKFIRSGLANPFGQNVSHRPVRQQAPTAVGGNDGNQKNGGENKDGLRNLGFDLSKNKPKGSSFNLPWLGTIDQTQVQSVVKLISAVILFLALFAAVLVYLKQQRSARVKELLGNHAPSTLVFLEVLGELKRYEFIKLPTETADELSDRARSQFALLVKGGRHVPQELPEAVSQFMDLYNEERFGGADNLDELNELSQRIKSLSHAKSGRPAK